MNRKTKILVLCSLILFSNFNCVALPGLVSSEEDSLTLFDADPSASAEVSGIGGYEGGMNVFAQLVQSLNSNPNEVCTADTCEVELSPCDEDAADEDCDAMAEYQDEEEFCVTDEDCEDAESF